MKKIALLSAFFLLTGCSNLPAETATTPNNTSTSTSTSSITIEENTTAPSYSTPSAPETAVTTEATPVPLTPEQDQAEFEKAAKLLKITTLKDCDRISGNMKALCIKQYQPVAVEPQPTPKPPITAPAGESASAEVSTDASSPQ